MINESVLRKSSKGQRPKNGFDKFETPRVLVEFNMIDMCERCLMAQPVHRWHFLTSKDRHVASIRDARHVYR